MAKASIPFTAMEPFNMEGGIWSRYIAQLEQKFIVHDVQEDKKLPILLSYMGSGTFDLLCDLISPKEPSDFRYDQVVNTLASHFSPAPLEIAENFRLHQLKQSEGESIKTFAADLQKLSKFCNLGTYLKTALRNQFVWGLKSESMQKRLLSEKNLTYETAVEIAYGMETAARDSAELHLSGAVSVDKLGFKKRLDLNIDSNKKRGVCFRCGS